MNVPQPNTPLLVRCVELHRAALVMGLEPQAWVMSPDVKEALASSITHPRFAAESAEPETLDGLPITLTDPGTTGMMGFLWKA